MQADDMGDKNYLHESVYYCVCLVRFHLVKLRKVPMKITNKDRKCEESGPIFEYYKCPKTYILMSRHPFFNLHIDLLG